MPYNFREIQGKLHKLGYNIVRQKGSHVIFSNGPKTIPVPKHDSKQITPGVEASIIRALGISKEEFKSL